ncbi:MAG: LacI family transcriptional regulator, partial [Rhodospirillaceae bacterium]|nr:LacI family transcriptional regulator [Rhodospirillaceae bacterium]
MAVGARLALKRAGIDPASIPTVGIDYISEARDAIRKGVQSATFIYPTVAREGIEYAMKILAGEKVPKEILVQSQIITRDNVEQIAPIF